MILADLPTAPPAPAEPDLVQFVFRAPLRAGLVHDARALLGAAPQELAASFEQAVRLARIAA